MLETSKDFLNIALGLSLFTFFIFLSWALYYLIQILRQIFKIFKETRNKINKIDELIKSIKEKIEHSTSGIVLIAEGVKKIAEIAKDKFENKNEQEDKEEE